MKICVAQTQPIKGDIKTNIENHKKLILEAISHHADIIIFPELSLTGYEPHLAKELAITIEDSRLDDLQKISDKNKISIGVGIPTTSNAGLHISMVLFQPHQPRQIYSKKYLHSDEYPFFVSGANLTDLKINNTNTALSICYEMSVPEHSENAFKNGAELYISSSAKTVSGVERAEKNLSDIARKYGVPVLMSNCIGPNDDFIGAGKTSVWNSEGDLVAQLDDKTEGLLIYDTSSHEVIRTEK